jgi:hypothetical protein
MGKWGYKELTKLGVTAARAMFAKAVREKDQRARLPDGPPGAVVQPQAGALGLEILSVGGRLLNERGTWI